MKRHMLDVIAIALVCVGTTGCGPVAVLGGAVGAGFLLEDGGGGGGSSDHGGPPGTPPTTPPPTAPLPTSQAFPGGGTFVNPVSVVLTANPSASSIHFTVDGSTPSVASPAYSGPIQITTNTTLQFFARDSQGTSGLVVTENYSFQAVGTAPATAPTALFTVSHTSARISTAFRFDASGSSDAQDGSAALQVRWDFESDGTWDTAFSTTKLASHTYTTEGTKRVRLEVRDTSGLTSQLERFVSVCTGGGDLTGDGIPDLVVGAPDFAGATAGSVFVFFGKPGFASVDLSSGGTPDLEFKGEVVGDSFGFTVTLGDLNGDGTSDLIVGARENGAGGSRAGRAYVFFGGSALKSRDLAQAGVNADATLTGPGVNREFSYQMATGDLNGDGHDDLAVGAPHESFAAPYEGRVFVFYGGPGFADVNLSAGGSASATFVGEADRDTFGLGVAIGDVTGDGKADLIAAAPHNDAGNFDAGRVYVFQGGSGFAGVDLSAAGVAHVVLTGDQSLDEFGFNTLLVGDVNADGKGDLIVGSYLNDAGGNSSGRLYVFFGGAGLANVNLSAGGSADLTFTGKAGSSLGNNGALADVNGDGRTDLLVGAPVPAGGQVHVFFGSATLAGVDLSAGGTANLTFTGRSAGDRLSVPGGADLNADGVPDLVIGALFEDSGGLDVGQVVVFKGGAITSTDLSAGGVADFTFTGRPGMQRFGSEVLGR